MKQLFNIGKGKLICKITWLMGGWATFRELGALSGKSLEETWQMVLDSSKHGIGLSYFSSAKPDILRRGTPWSNHLLPHVSLSLSVVLYSPGQSDTTHISHYRIGLGSFWTLLTSLRPGGPGGASLLEFKHQQRFGSREQASLTFRRSTVLVDQCAAEAPSHKRCWVAFVRP